MLINEIKEQEDGRYTLEVDLSSEEIDLLVTVAIRNALEDYVSDSSD